MVQRLGRLRELVEQLLVGGSLGWYRWCRLGSRRRQYQLLGWRNVSLDSNNNIWCSLPLLADDDAGSVDWLDDSVWAFSEGQSLVLEISLASDR